MVVDFVKYAFVISNYLRGYIALVIVAFLVCSFPWGSYGWMSYFDFRRISYEEGISMAIDTISPEDYSIPRATYGEPDFKIPAGTPIRVYGFYRDLPENFQSRHLLVETPDSFRTVVFRPGAYPEVIINGHDRVDDVLLFRQIVYSDDAEKMKGMTLGEFEKHMDAMARSVYRFTSNGEEFLAAAFPGFDFMGDSCYYKGLTAVFKDGKLFGCTGMRNESPAYYRWVAKLGNYWMSHSVAHYAPGFYKPTKGYGPFRSWNYMFRWMARGVMGIFDVLAPLVIFLTLFLVFYFTIYRIQAVPIIAAELLLIVVTGVCDYLYLLYTMEFSPNLFFFLISGMMAWNLCMSLMSYTRCPSCGALGTLEEIGVREGSKTSVSLDTHHSTDDEISTERVHNVLVHNILRRHYTTTHRAEGQDYYVIMRCTNCGHTFEKKEHVTTKVQSTTRED